MQMSQLSMQRRPRARLPDRATASAAWRWWSS